MEIIDRIIEHYRGDARCHECGGSLQGTKIAKCHWEGCNNWYYRHYPDCPPGAKAAYLQQRVQAAELECRRAEAQALLDLTQE